MSCLQKFLFHALESNLIHLVQDNEYLVHGFLPEPAVQGHSPQDFPVVDPHCKSVVRADFSQGRGGGQDQFNLSKAGGIAQDIDITLDKLAEAPSLGLVGAPYAAHLQCLEGLWKVRRIVRIIA